MRGFIILFVIIASCIGFFYFITYTTMGQNTYNVLTNVSQQIESVSSPLRPVGVPEKICFNKDITNFSCSGG